MIAFNPNRPQPRISPNRNSALAPDPELQDLNPERDTVTPECHLVGHREALFDGQLGRVKRVAYVEAK